MYIICLFNLSETVNHLLHCSIYTLAILCRHPFFKECKEEGSSSGLSSLYQMPGSQCSISEYGL